MKIKWNGHASFTITSSQGTVIVTDPYQPGCFDGGIGYEAVDDRTDVALISHDHDDHNHTASLSGGPEVLRSAGHAKDIDFEAVETAHDESGGSERGKNLLFAFPVDGLRIGFMGDLGHLLEDDQLSKLGKIDVLLVPIGGVFTIGPQGAAKLVEQIGPRLVIPMHYKTDKCGFPIAEVDDFAKLFTNVKKTGKTEIEVTDENVPASGPEVWVLEHAR